jgi:hypothetical protein
MTAAVRLPSSATDIKERAQALVRRGRVQDAADLVDGFLARHDAGWHLWRLCGELSQRLGRLGAAVAAFRACARQLEAAGHVDAAASVLRHALRLAPLDDQLRADVRRRSRARPTPVLPLQTPRLPPRAPTRPRLESVTDPHLAIFDILDAEAAQLAATPALPGRPRRHR